MSITFRKRNRGSTVDGDHPKIIGYMDASWVDNVDDRKSTTGAIFIYNCCGIIVYKDVNERLVFLSFHFLLNDENYML
jgi:hypothetical protein